MLNNGNIVCYMSIYYDSRSQEMGRHSTGYGLCNLISARYSERVGGTDAAPTFRLGESREYTAGGHVITGNSVLMSRFGCGYFDASGRPHYYLTDWQGNNIGVVDRDGKIEQRTDYYPYGEPWLEPEATTPGGTTASPTANRNRFLYGDKERIRTGGLNEYCFPARDYVPGFPRFTTIDPMCEVRPHQSPYLFCGGNPVMYTDPTGMLWADEQEAERLKGVINNRISELKKDIAKNNRKIEENMSKGKKYEKQERANQENEAMIGCLTKSLEDIDLLGKDPLHTYSFERVQGEIHQVKQGRRGAVVIQTSEQAYTIHEITHVRQGLDAGGLQFNQYRLMKNPGINDKDWQKASGNNEVEAYKAQFSLSPYSIRSIATIFEITLEYVGNIKYNDNYGYPWLHDYLYEK